MNPILPRNICIPDPEAHVWDDGRLYIYGSRDVPGADYYCSPTHSVFSTDDLITWKDHGTCFTIEDSGMTSFPRLSAPDCIYNDGRYYMHFCIHGESGREGVAVSDKPDGPFKDASPVEGADHLGIDPAAFVDDDGQAYLYWGQFDLKAAKLNPDMRSIVPETYNPALINEKDHGFHEGASVRKVGDKYYLIYCDISRGRATCMSYAIADNPLGPFRKGGIFLDNAFCDPMSWNIHGSICEFKGQWYVFYHRCSQNSKFSRRACLEPITINPDGSIDEVCMTTQGAGGPIPATTELESWRMCSMYGAVYTVVEGDQEHLHLSREGDSADFKYLSFNGERSFRARVRGRGRLSIRRDQPFWYELASVEIDSPDKWVTIEVPVTDVIEGVHSIHFYNAEGSFDVMATAFSIESINDQSL